jgi:DNA-binding NarL/FixJ family response regulator
VSAALPTVERSTLAVPSSSTAASLPVPYAVGTLLAQKTARATSIVLADRFELIRQGMRNLLEADGEFAVVGEAGDGWSALDLVDQQRPAVLVIDFSLAGLSGLEVTRHVVKRFPQTRILMLSTQPDEAYVLEALKSGATGYALKQSESGALLQAVRDVAAGRRYLSPSLSERAIEVYMSMQHEQDSDLEAHGPLTSREREVLRLVASGLTSAQIAEQLSISPRTAETHRANMMRKLGLRNQAELIRYALQHHFVPSENGEP